MFGFDVMVSMLVMVAVGGKGTLIGPVIGAILVTFVPEQLRLVQEFRLSIFGLVLMLSVVRCRTDWRARGCDTRVLGTLGAFMTDKVDLL